MKQLMSLYYGIKIKRLTKVKLHLGYAGYCLAKETHTIKGGNNINVKFNALWALIHHPINGYILFDTGYTKRFFEATKKYPNKLYANLTKVVLKKGEEVKEQLKILDQYPLKEYDVLYQVIGFKIRLYADSYNRIENKRSLIQSRLLISLLILNVATLTTQAIFLKADSKEIDDEG